MSHHPLIEAFQRAGQGHVFAFFDQLDAAAQQRLLAEAAEVDLAEFDRLGRTLLTPAGEAGVAGAGLAPAPYEPRPENGGDPAAWAAARAAGEEALRAGRVAVFTVAGGQGTRLGFDGPKGTFPVTPVKEKALFQVFAEKIAAAGRRFGRPLHWFIMTSHANHAATEAFFAGYDYFGLGAGHIHLFRQGRMPAAGHDGKILLAAKDAIALAPDGHGGSLRALDRSGSLDLMAQAGADTISYFQVDNPLVRCVDAEFIGWHLLRGAEMSAKTTPKTGPGEKVGHFCLQEGWLTVVEYTDLPAALQQETGPDGQLRYRAGSIGIHVFDREFVRRMARGGAGAAMPFHRADKKVPCLDAAGRPVKPTAPNGVKFELFVFDALPFARRAVVIETRRADDFSPVKNATGEDSPATCRADQLRQWVRWLRAAGAEVPADATGRPPFALEVSPLFGYDEDTFAASWRRLAVRPPVAAGLYLA